MRGAFVILLRIFARDVAVVIIVMEIKILPSCEYHVKD